MAAFNIIGGKGYRWAGRAIRVVQKDRAICATMPRRDSLIMASAVVSPGAKYKVVIMASRNTGNGALLVNFFGGKHCDGQPISVNITSNKMQEYEVVVTAPSGPPNIPIYLRVYKPNNATGNVFVKLITYRIHDGEQKKQPARKPKMRMPRVPAPIPMPRKIKEHVGPIRPKRTPKRKIKHRPKPKSEFPKRKVKVDSDMKFKPFKVIGPNAAQSVLIRNPEDVPKVSIIIPTRDGLELLKKCHEAITKNTCYPNWEVVIGDSESSDETAKYIKSIKDPRVKLVERGTTEGSFSSINNELVQHAAGEYLLFLNNDTQPQPFWLYNMMTRLRGDPKVGIVGAKLLYSPTKIQHVGIAMTPQGPGNIGKSMLSSFPKRFARHHRTWQAVTAACLLISRKDFEDVGGFDEDYYFCYEDVDLCLRVKKQLKKLVLYTPRAAVIHSESVTQKKYKTGGLLQRKGIDKFKRVWMNGEAQIDLARYQKQAGYGLYDIDISFVTCVNNMTQYRNYVLASLFKNKTNKKYEVIPVLNFENQYTAAQALNKGLDLARGKLVVFCHQDVLFYERWIDILYDRIAIIEKRNPEWGVIGTAGISKRDDTIGVVFNMKGNFQWRATKKKLVWPVQTVDEHCMVIRKASRLRFDESNATWHMYGPDICLQANANSMRNFGIYNPLVHNSASGSLSCGKKEFMSSLYWLRDKWHKTYSFIRTPTSIIRKKSIRTFVRFAKGT